MQGTIILGSAVVLGTHAIERVRRPVPIESSWIAIGVMVLSIFATIAITSYLKRHSGESSALRADSLHYTSDIVSNIATIAALVVVRITANPLFDSILGVPVACWIGRHQRPRGAGLRYSGVYP